MSRFVIESPVAVKWFVPEENSSRCSRLLDGGHELLALSTLPVEAGRIVTAKMCGDELTPEEAVAVMDAVRALPVALYDPEPLLIPGMEIAFIYDRPLTDGLNLSLAVWHDCRLVTAQWDLFDVLRDTAFTPHVKWVGDIR